jgi:hypothetical protein
MRRGSTIRIYVVWIGAVLKEGYDRGGAVVMVLDGKYKRRCAMLLIVDVGLVLCILYIIRGHEMQKSKKWVDQTRNLTC